MSRSRPLLSMVVLVMALVPVGVARASTYANGFYSGRTSQGKTITLVVAGGQVSELNTQIVDSCHPGSLLEFLHPYPTRIDAHGNWYHRAAGIPAQPTIYHGHLGAGKARGTIDDTADTKAGKRCHGHLHFSAVPSSPLRLGSATVGAHGTDALVRLTVPAALDDSGAIVPDTSLGLLVYGSNTGCPSTYKAADALARSQPGGYLGLISDAYVSADWGSANVRRRSGQTFTFDVSTNTLLPTASGASPFSTVCAMLYRGTPAPLNPAANAAVQTAHGPLVPGPGAPVHQL
jgi:hypothetical protein